jgi:biotin transport system ATP-binding protein
MESMREQERPSIVYEDVRLSRGDGLLFNCLTLALRERRIGLIGNNGSGKSSLLRLANGLLLPDGGKVITSGLDTRADRKALPDLAGFLFQNPDHQIVFPTVAEEIGFGLRERGRDARQAREAAEELLTAHDCAGWADRPIHQLSDGQKQLVCILAVTITQPRILLLDEPFASLDLPTRHGMMQRLDALPQQIIMASHDLDLLMGFERIVWLDRGIIRADGTAAEVIGAYRRFWLPGTPGFMMAAQ